MGIFSDILEDNRDSLRAGDVDPAMMPSLHYYRKNVQVKKYLEISEYSSSFTKQEQKHLLQQIFAQNYSDLENAKNNYIILEKFTLEIINRDMVETTVLKNTLKNIYRKINRSYSAMCELLDECSRNQYINVEYHYDENELRLELLSNIVNSVLLTIKCNDRYDGEEAAFRNIVNDCASVINYLQNQKKRLSAKETVRNYFESQGIYKTECTCRNCGDKLYEGIDYCLTCYERDV